MHLPRTCSLAWKRFTQLSPFVIINPIICIIGLSIWGGLVKDSSPLTTVLIMLPAAAICISYWYNFSPPRIFISTLTQLSTALCLSTWIASTITAGIELGIGYGFYRLFSYIASKNSSHSRSSSLSDISVLSLPFMESILTIIIWSILVSIIQTFIMALIIYFNLKPSHPFYSCEKFQHLQPVPQQQYLQRIGIYGELLPLDDDDGYDERNENNHNNSHVGSGGNVHHPTTASGDSLHATIASTTASNIGSDKIFLQNESKNQKNNNNNQFFYRPIGNPHYESTNTIPHYQSTSHYQLTNTLPHYNPFIEPARLQPTQPLRSIGPYQPRLTDDGFISNPDDLCLYHDPYYYSSSSSAASTSSELFEVSRQSYNQPENPFLQSSISVDQQQDADFQQEQLNGQNKQKSEQTEQNGAQSPHQPHKLTPSQHQKQDTNQLTPSQHQKEEERSKSTLTSIGEQALTPRHREPNTIEQGKQVFTPRHHEMNMIKHDDGDGDGDDKKEVNDGSQKKGYYRDLDGDESKDGHHDSKNRHHYDLEEEKDSYTSSPHYHRPQTLLKPSKTSKGPSNTPEVAPKQSKASETGTSGAFETSKTTETSKASQINNNDSKNTTLYRPNTTVSTHRFPIPLPPVSSYSNSGTFSDRKDSYLPSNQRNTPHDANQHNIPRNYQLQPLQPFQLPSSSSSSHQPTLEHLLELSSLSQHHQHQQQHRQEHQQQHQHHQQQRQEEEQQSIPLDLFLTTPLQSRHSPMIQTHTKNPESPRSLFHPQITTDQSISSTQPQKISSNQSISSIEPLELLPTPIFSSIEPIEPRPTPISSSIEPIEPLPTPISSQFDRPITPILLPQPVPVPFQRLQSSTGQDFVSINTTHTQPLFKVYQIEHPTYKSRIFGLVIGFSTGLLMSLMIIGAIWIHFDPIKSSTLTPWPLSIALTIMFFPHTLLLYQTTIVMFSIYFYNYFPYNGHTNRQLSPDPSILSSNSSISSQNSTISPILYSKLTRFFAYLSNLIFPMINTMAFMIINSLLLTRLISNHSYISVPIFLFFNIVFTFYQIVVVMKLELSSLPVNFHCTGSISHPTVKELYNYHPLMSIPPIIRTSLPLGGDSMAALLPERNSMIDPLPGRNSMLTTEPSQAQPHISSPQIILKRPPLGNSLSDRPPFGTSSSV